jgi:hypothetical protein
VGFGKAFYPLTMSVGALFKFNVVTASDVGEELHFNVVGESGSVLSCQLPTS